MKERLDNIIDFLSNRLDREDRETFEKELRKDPISAEDNKVHQAMLQYIDQSGDLEMKQWLKTVVPKYQKKPKANSNTRILRWLIPAAAAAILLLFFLPALFQPTLNANQLADNYLQPYELTFGDRSGGEDVLREGGQRYQTGEYAAAAPLLEQAVNQSEDGTYRLALGISYLQTGAYPKAIKNLEQLISSADPIYADHARWYLALAQLQVNNIAAAKEQLEHLATDATAFNHLKAKALLEEKIFSEKK